MVLCRYAVRGGIGWGWIEDGQVLPVNAGDVRETFSAPGPAGLRGLRARADSGAAFPLTDLDGEPGLSRPGSLLAPLLDAQEVWATGVSYENPRLASLVAAGDISSVYARLYAAERPQLFYKAPPRNVVGQDGPVRVRPDSLSTIPEPELTALFASDGRLLGYTIGNDMSARDIEDANPLYQAQAKVYRGSCALGPFVVPADSLDPRSVAITETIRRRGAIVYSGEGNTARMRRAAEAVSPWLFRENEYPAGVYLMTGTCVAPGEGFTLEPGDVITMTFEGIGELRTVVAD